MVNGISRAAETEISRMTTSAIRWRLFEHSVA